jgi:hypothetical protein
MERVRAVVSRILSYRKRTWRFEDYAVRLRRQDVDSQEHFGRLEPVIWSAQIINWWQMAGHGGTEDEALANLRANFEQFCATHDTLPRPGTSTPLEYASSSLVERHERLAREFLRRVLDMDYQECFISDESSLWDFHVDDTNEEVYRKIVELYGVDVSDIDGANLGLIFERIASKQKTG